MSSSTMSDFGESWITFLSHRSGNNLLYRMRPDGSELTPIFGGELAGVPGLTAGQSLYRQPHWTRQSPDREYFLSWARDVGFAADACLSSGQFMIYLGRTDGGPTRLIATNASEVFTWAHDSRQFAYSRFPGPDPRCVTGIAPRVPSTQVVLADIDGSHEDVVIEKPGYWTACDWSPDGAKLLLLFEPARRPQFGRSDLIALDLIKARTQKERMIELKPGQDFASGLVVEWCLDSLTDGQPIGWFADSRYAPDGNRIATVFSRRTRLIDPGFHELGLFDIASETLQPIAAYPHPDKIHGPICWAPDGSEILISRPLQPEDRRENLESDDATGLGIWAIRSDGTSTRFLTTGWSPDWR
jgi:hypothetical protein